MLKKGIQQCGISHIRQRGVLDKWSLYVGIFHSNRILDEPVSSATFQTSPLLNSGQSFVSERLCRAGSQAAKMPRKAAVDESIYGV